MRLIKRTPQTLAVSFGLLQHYYDKAKLYVEECHSYGINNSNLSSSHVSSTDAKLYREARELIQAVEDAELGKLE